MYIHESMYIYIHACDVQHDTILRLDVFLDFSYILVLHLGIRILYGAPARKGSIRTGFDNPKMCVFLCIESLNLVLTKKMMMEQTHFSCPPYCQIMFLFIVPAGETLHRDMNCCKLPTRWKRLRVFWAMCALELGIRGLFLGEASKPPTLVTCHFTKLGRWLDSWREALTILEPIL